MAGQIAFDPSQDPHRVAANQRALIQNRGDVLAQQQQDQADQEAQRRKQSASYLDQLYAPDAEGQGGYNPQEQQDIMGQQGLDQLQQTGAEHDANYLNEGERAGMGGDTGSYSKYFDPNQMDQNTRVAQGQQSQAVDDLSQGLTKAVDAGQLRQSDTYKQNSRNILDRNQSGFDTAMDNTRGNVRGAIDPSKVTASDSFLNDYNMSPEEQQNIVTGAGISEGTGYRAAVDDAQRRSAAAGASPMGVEAYRARMERAGAGAAGDAMTQARIKASDAAAARKMSGEQLREQGGQYLTGVKTNTEMGLGQEALQGQEALGNQQLGQENTMEQNRQGAEQFLTQEQMDAAKTAGGAKLQNAQLSTAQGQQQGQYAATTGTGIAEAQDRDAAARNAAIATNRQGAEQYNQGQRYGRGMDQNTLTSNRATTVGNQRLNQQDLGRNYYQGQNEQANQNSQNAQNRQQQTYATQTGGTNAAANTGLAASEQPGTFGKIVGGVTGLVGALGGASGIASGAKKLGLADGGIVTSPTLALIGEDGPEQVTPLSYRATAKVRPSMAFQQEPQMRKRSFYGEAA